MHLGCGLPAATAIWILGAKNSFSRLKGSFDCGGCAASAQDDRCTWVRVDAASSWVGVSVAAGGGGEGLGVGGLLLLPVRIKEIKDATNCPVSQGDPENEGQDDGEEQKERKQERRHIPLILQAKDGS